MTNIQDDQLTNSGTATGGDINDYQPEAVNADQQPSADNPQAVGDDNPVLTSDDSKPIAGDDPGSKPKPSKADVDELLSQLEALNQEIAAKTVVDQPQLEEKKDQSRDVDLDKFINELEAKIAEKNQDDEDQQEPAIIQEEPTAFQQESVVIPEEPTAFQQEPVVTPEEPKLSLAEEPKTEPAKEELDKQDDLIKEVIGGEEAIGREETKDIEENFGRKRPSLDLSGVSEEINPFQPATVPPVAAQPPAVPPVQEPSSLAEEEIPALTLNNGQLQEDQANLGLNSPLASAGLINEAELVDEEEPVNPEDLESQNIFTMLGLESLEEAEKEAFLADLEKLIWDNFIEVELPLLLTSEEKAQVDQILADTTKVEDERKEALLVYLENIVPNLEEMMYKQALSLKKEMFEERVNKMREQAIATNDLGLIADLDQIQDLIRAERYQTAVDLLNKA